MADEPMGMGLAYSPSPDINAIYSAGLRVLAQRIGGRSAPGIADSLLRDLRDDGYELVLLRTKEVADLIRATANAGPEVTDAEMASRLRLAEINLDQRIELCSDQSVVDAWRSYQAEAHTANAGGAPVDSELLQEIATFLEQECSGTHVAQFHADQYASALRRIAGTQTTGRADGSDA
jgi:hypothetical protein